MLFLRKYFSLNTLCRFRVTPSPAELASATTQPPHRYENSSLCHSGESHPSREGQTCLHPHRWILLRLKDWNDSFTFELYFRENLSRGMSGLGPVLFPHEGLRWTVDRALTD